MKTNVANTSIETYHSIDFSSQAGKVAVEIRRLTNEGKRAYIALIAHNLGMEKSTTAARFNDLKEKPFLVRGQWYKMEHAGQHRMPDPKNTVILRRVDTWGIIPCEAPAEQTTLFL